MATRPAQWKSVCRDADIAPTSLPIDRCRKSLDRRRFLNANKRSGICEGIIATARALANSSMRSATAVRFLEDNLRVHYPNLRVNDSLFPEFTSHDFTAIGHRGYTRVLRQLSALQNRLYACTKFDKLMRYRCANLFFLVLPAELFRDSEIPVGWGALVEHDGTLTLRRKPVWHETTAEDRLRFLQRIAITGTRVLNRQLEITLDDVIIERCRSF